VFGAANDTTLARPSISFTTDAIVGSGVAYPLAVLQMTGVPTTLALKAWVTTGTASMTLGLGDPYGQNAAVASYSTIALTTTPTTFYQSFTGTADETYGGLMWWLAQTAAAAVTVRMTDISVTMGKQVFPFAPTQAAGIDIADDDTALVGLVGDNAKDALAACNVSLTAHWIRPTANTPYWQYVTRARQSLVGKASSATLTNVQGLGQINFRRADTYQRVIVSYGGALYNNLAIAQASDALRDRAGTTRQIVIAAGRLISSWTDAHEVAALRLSREQSARARPTLDLMELVPTIFDLEADDLVLLTTSNATYGMLYSALPLTILTRTVTKSDGIFRRASYETEEFKEA
jgi:hypothetical protein